MKNYRKITLFLIVSILCVTCGKKDSSSGGVTPPPPPPPPTSTTCIISGISQVNSGNKSEAALTAFYDNNYNTARILIYDSVSNIKRFDASFNYITSDSIRIDANQYIKLDAGKRVVLFATKSDLTNPTAADDYKLEYLYNEQGYLGTKNLYINGSKLPNFRTTYTYTNNLLTNCLLTSVSSGNLKVLEAALVYDSNIKIKNWMYLFPDGFEDYEYTTVLNFGNRPPNPPTQIVTKIYNPSTGVLLDTWTTNYSGYKVDSNGYVTYGVASGDLQQGIAMFYGKTNFYYQCH